MTKEEKIERVKITIAKSRSRAYLMENHNLDIKTDTMKATVTGEREVKVDCGHGITLCITTLTNGRYHVEETTKKSYNIKA